MKVWRLFDDGSPVRDLLSPDEASEGREGYGVYEVLNEAGEVIYTGRTKQLRTRLRQHARAGADFWLNAVEVRWTPCGDYAEAVAVERVGINVDQGEFNVASKLTLPTNGRCHLPPSVASRLRGLYAASDQDRWAALDFHCFVATLRHLGWTLQSMADALNITREGIRLHSLRGVVDHDLALPARPARQPRERKFWPRLSASDVAELRRLYAQARLCRGPHLEGHPYRLASERLTELIAEAKLRGVRNQDIADAMGASMHTVVMRLARHGYMKTPPSISKYGARSWSGKREFCKHGHPLSGDNLRLINGDPDRRACRACQRRRSAAYQQRRRAS